jgi:hypothetical protein
MNKDGAHKKDCHEKYFRSFLQIISANYAIFNLVVTLLYINHRYSPFQQTKLRDSQRDLLSDTLSNRLYDVLKNEWNY